MASTYKTIWANLKLKGKVKILIPDVEDKTHIEMKVYFNRIRKHVSDCKARDTEYRLKFRNAYLYAEKTDFKEGYIILALLSDRNIQLGTEVNLLEQSPT